LAHLGFADDSASWDPSNDYTSGDESRAGAWYATTRTQLLGADDAVVYGWSRPASPP